MSGQFLINADLRFEDVSRKVHLDRNPVAGYAAFCLNYNLSYNVVDNTPYEVPDLTSNGYKFLRTFWNPFRSDADGGCCLVTLVLRLILFVSPLAWLLAAWGSLVYFMACLEGRFREQDRSLATYVLAANIALSLVALIILPIILRYMFLFYGLVASNFDRVPRSRVLSNMVYVSELEGRRNQHLEVSGYVAAALRRNEIRYDQINDTVVLRELEIQRGAVMKPVRLMVYTDSFVKLLDDYDTGFFKRVLFLLLAPVLIVGSSWTLAQIYS